MKKILLLFLLYACTANEKKRQDPFPVLTVSEDEWATYEGRWLTNDAIISFELSLKSGAFGIDSYYKLQESIVSDNKASGTTSYGLYSTNTGFANKELGICLHDLSTYTEGSYLRFKKSDSEPEEMFFITRGNDELLPCDNGFKPITTDWRYTLHKRSSLFTVEGYITFEQDSAELYERNTSDHWKVADLGEFDKLRIQYIQLAKVRHEGIYLRALAYSVGDTTSPSGNYLVIKRIKNMGKDPVDYGIDLE